MPGQNKRPFCSIELKRYRVGALYFFIVNLHARRSAKSHLSIGVLLRNLGIMIGDQRPVFRGEVYKRRAAAICLSTRLGIQYAAQQTGSAKFEFSIVMSRCHLDLGLSV